MVHCNLYSAMVFPRAVLLVPDCAVQGGGIQPLSGLGIASFAGAIYLSISIVGRDWHLGYAALSLGRMLGYAHRPADALLFFRHMEVLDRRYRLVSSVASH